VPLVRVAPRADLLQPILGDVDGARLALLLERELMADVERAAFGTVAGRIATAAADGAQAGRQQRAGRAALFEATVQLPTNQGGMLGQTQGSLRKRGESLHSKARGKEGAKKGRCEKKGLDRRSDSPDAGARQAGVQQRTTGARKLPFLRAAGKRVPLEAINSFARPSRVSYKGLWNCSPTVAASTRQY